MMDQNVLVKAPLLPIAKLKPVAGLNLLHSLSMCQSSHRVLTQHPEDTALPQRVSKHLFSPSADSAISVAPQLPNCGCPPHLRKELSRNLNFLLDIASGRRRFDVLRKVAMEHRVRAAVTTLTKTGQLRGASLRSFHPSPGATVRAVDFVGTIQLEQRVRAFVGRFDNQATAQYPHWTLSAFRLV